MFKSFFSPKPDAAAKSEKQHQFKIYQNALGEFRVREVCKFDSDYSVAVCLGNGCKTVEEVEEKIQKHLDYREKSRFKLIKAVTFA